jgi:YD repeat-containing protein
MGDFGAVPKIAPAYCRHRDLWQRPDAGENLHLRYLLNALQVLDGATGIIDRTHAFGDGINLTGITESAVSGRNEGYAYSNANRLQNATGPWDMLTYSYDLVGNRTSEALTQGSITTTWSYAYPSGSNLLSTVTEGANVRTFTHDGGGNISADGLAREELAAVVKDEADGKRKLCKIQRA